MTCSLRVSLASGEITFGPRPLPKQNLLQPLCVLSDFLFLTVKSVTSEYLQMLAFLSLSPS